MGKGLSGNRPAVTPSARAVVFNVFGHGNKGDAMLLDTLLDQLGALVPRRNIAGISFDVASERRWAGEFEWHERIGNRPVGGGRLAVLDRAVRVMVLAAMASSRRFLPLRRFLPRSQQEAVAALAGADVAISCPGGYLEDSNHAYLINTLQLLVAARLAKRVILAPQSIGPVRSSLGRRILVHALRRMDAVYVREEASRVFVEDLCGPGAVALRKSGDMAFWYGRPAPDGLDGEWRRLGIDPSRPIYGITVVGWSFPHVADPQGQEERYLKALGAVIDRIGEDPAAQIVAFNQVAGDLPTVERLAAMNPRLIVDREERDCATFAAMIRACRALVASRFHSCIFGLLGSVPTIAIAYLPKTSGIMADLGLADLTIPINDLDPARLLALYQRTADEREAIRRRIAAAVARYRDENDGFLHDLPGLLGP